MRPLVPRPDPARPLVSRVLCCKLANLFPALLLSACSTTASIQPDGTLVRHYLGYVRVVVPQAQADHPVYVSNVSTLGLRFADGVSVGYVRDKQTVVPIDCRFVLLVSTQKQLEDALQKLSLFQGMPNVCAAVSPTLQKGNPP